MNESCSEQTNLGESTTLEILKIISSDKKFCGETYNWETYERLSEADKHRTNLQPLQISKYFEVEWIDMKSKFGSPIHWTIQEPY